MASNDRWLGAVEGFYGTPLTHADRAELVEWLGDEGFNCYAYAPKHDPFHRDRWRDPYPDEEMDRFRELAGIGRSSGAELAVGISPGLDWRDGDEPALIRKLAAFEAIGVRTLAVAFDDVPPGGDDLGRRHGAAVTAAVAALDPGIRWVTCPTDYATPVATPYLRAFVAELPDAVDVMWTGPSIVSLNVDGAAARAVSDELGRPLLFAENFPVNDGPMEGCLHLGPYPARGADLVDATTGVFCNFMGRARASRVGLGAAARFWRDPHRDRDDAWREVLARIPGIEPLARACRSWAGDGGPDPELLAWADAAMADPSDTRLRDFLTAGCRRDLDPSLAAEVEPWLEQWDRQSQAMQFALALLAAPGRPAEIAFPMASLWQRARELPQETFGTRWAAYPVTTWVDGRFHALPEGLVRGDNLTDRLCTAALTAL